MRIQILKKGLVPVLAVLVILTGCGLTAPEKAKSFPTEKNELIFQVEMQNSDTIASLEDQYKGEVVALLPEDGLAILTSNASSHIQQQNILLEQNIDAVVLPTEGSLQGSGVFGGGVFGGGVFGGGVFGGGVNSSYLVHNQDAWNQIELFDAHRFTTRLGQNVKVAVVDTGADVNHKLLDGSFSPSNEWKDYIDADFDPSDELGGNFSGHGTAVSGIILQVAPNAEILPIRILDIDGTGDMDDLISAIIHAVNNNADIINLSLGSLSNSSVLKSAIQYAKKQGIYVVAAAGNENKNKANFPARYSSWKDYESHIFGVGSVDSRYNRSSFSNYGVGAVMSAPGEAIQTTYPGDMFVNATGTSFATPIVAGGVALLLAEKSSVDVKSVLSGSLRFPTTNVEGTVSMKLLLESVVPISPVVTNPSLKPDEVLVDPNDVKTIDGDPIILTP